MGDVTELLNRTCQGDREAQDELFRRIYAELERRVSFERRDFGGLSTVQTAELVSELWMKLKLAAGRSFESRKQFFALAAKAVHNLLVDRARARNAAKRGRDWQALTLTLNEPEAEESIDVDVLALHELLPRLARISPLQAQILELRFFGGGSRREVAELLELTNSELRTAEDHAKAWLRAKLLGR